MSKYLSRFLVLSLIVLGVPSVYGNGANPSYNYDANGDTFLSDDDANAVINYLNSGAETNVQTLAIDAALAVLNGDPNAPALQAAAENAARLDVTDDNFVSPIDALVIINLLGNSPFQNANNQLDVNADTFVSPIDLLIVVNEANSRPPGDDLFLEVNACVAPFPDVSGDNFFSPIDLLILINHFNS